VFVYIESIKNPAVRFEVLEYDKETKIGKLRGGFGTVITRDISKDELVKRGYKIIKSETPLSLTPPPVKGEAKPKVEVEE
jgi:adenine specific DNA methylase Mod